MSVPLDASLRLAAALAIAALAAAALVARGRSSLHRLSGMLLASSAAVLAIDGAAASVASGSATRDALQRASYVVSIVQALLAVALAIEIDRAGGAASREPARRRAFVAAALVAAGLAFAYAWMPSARPDAPILVLALVATFCVGATLLLLAIALADHRRRVTPASRLLFLGIAVVALPQLHRVPGLFVAGATWSHEANLLVSAAFTLALVASVALRLPAAEPPRSRGLVVATLVLAAASGFAVHASIVAHEDDPTLKAFVTAGSWMGFAILTTASVLRHHAVPLDLRARRRAARIVLGAFLLVGGLFALAGLRLALGLPPDVGSYEAILIVGVACLSQGVRTTVDVVAERLLGVPHAGDARAVESAYAAAVERAGDAGLTRDAPDLVRARDELGISPARARAIERAVELSRAAPLVAGRSFAARYVIEGALGQGGSGRVLLARDVELDRTVALKEVFGADAAASAPEARVAASVVHPCVVATHDVIPRRASVVLVMEHVPGGTLANALARNGLPRATRVSIAKDVLEGLRALHAAGVTHCDLKPSNVLLTLDQRAKIADFGAAARRAEGADATLARGDGGPVRLAGGASLGTPGTSAPEVLRGEPPTPAADVYSAGVLLRRLFPGEPALEALLARATAEAPGERPTVHELDRAFRRALDGAVAVG